MRLRESPQHDDRPFLPHILKRVRVLKTALSSEVIGVVAIGFVEHCDDMRRQAIKEAVDRIRIQDRARRVVGVRDVHHSRVNINLFENALQIVAVVQRRHFNKLCAGRARDNRIGNERQFTGDGVQPRSEQRPRKDVQKSG